MFVMKKIIVAILALLYITTSTGATIHMHYCMGELADWGIGLNDSKTCGKCGMDKSDEKDNGCCNDEQKQVKLETDHQKAGLIGFINFLAASAIGNPHRPALLDQDPRDPHAGFEPQILPV